MLLWLNGSTGGHVEQNVWHCPSATSVNSENRHSEWLLTYLLNKTITIAVGEAGPAYDRSGHGLETCSDTVGLEEVHAGPMVSLNHLLFKLLSTEVILIILANQMGESFPGL